MIIAVNWYDEYFVYWFEFEGFCATFLVWHFMDNISLSFVEKSFQNIGSKILVNQLEW